MIQNGVDALILEGNEAGGHIGPVSINVLVQEILALYKRSSNFCSGRHREGRNDFKISATWVHQVVKLEQDLCADESIAHEKFKNIFIKSEARNAQVSIKIDERLPVIPVRAIENKATQDFINEQKKLFKFGRKTKNLSKRCAALNRTFLGRIFEEGSY